MIILAMICIIHWDTWPKSKMAIAAIIMCMLGEFALEMCMFYQLLRHWI